MLDHLALRKSVSPDCCALFMEAYVHTRADEKTAHPFYNQWMRHKFIHSLEVLDVGLLILKKEAAFKLLPQDVKQDFADALLLHDLSRAHEIDPTTGADILPNHGADTARRLYETGLFSLNVLVPVLMHDRLEDDLLHLPPEAIDPVFKDTDLKTRAAVKAILAQYHALPKESRDTVYKGVWLVKDADKLANIMTVPRLLPFIKNGVQNPKAVLSDRMTEAFLKTDGIVSRHYVSTLLDAIPHLFSWMRGLYFPYSFKLAVSENLPKRVFQTILFNAEKPKDSFQFKQDVRLLKRFTALTEDRLKQRAGGPFFSIPFYSPLRMPTLSAG